MDWLYVIFDFIRIFLIAWLSYFIAGMLICLIADLIIFFTKKNKKEEE